MCKLLKNQDERSHTYVESDIDLFLPARSFYTEWNPQHLFHIYSLSFCTGHRLRKKKRSGD